MTNPPTNILRTGAYILAAGKREHTPGVPKLLEDVEGTPVLHHVINAVKGTQRIKGDESLITVIISSRFYDQLQDSLAVYPNIRIAVQENHMGTADAIWQAIDQGKDPNCGHVFVLMGDQPLIQSRDLDAFYRDFISQPLVRAAILAFREDRNRREYQKCARVFFDDGGNFHYLKTRVPIEENELLHAGPYLFEGPWLRGALAMLHPHVEHHPEKEFHLYEALRGARFDTGVQVCVAEKAENFLGADDKGALKEIRRRMHIRLFL